MGGKDCAGQAFGTGCLGHRRVMHCASLLATSALTVKVTWQSKEKQEWPQTLPRCACREKEHHMGQEAGSFPNSHFMAGDARLAPDLYPASGAPLPDLSLCIPPSPSGLLALTSWPWTRLLLVVPEENVSGRQSAALRKTALHFLCSRDTNQCGAPQSLLPVRGALGANRSRLAGREGPFSCPCFIDVGPWSLEPSMVHLGLPGPEKFVAS